MDNKKLGQNYSSPSQRARVLTEAWVYVEVFCHNCGRSSIERYANNDPVRDFFCPKQGDEVNSSLNIYSIPLRIYQSHNKK